VSSRRRLPSLNRCLIVRWPAIAAVLLCGATQAEPPAVETKSEITLVAPTETEPANSPEPTGEPRSASELELVAPSNSTIQLRVARRPWLLDKLSGKKTEPSQKMNPPQPPIELPDPPSMSRSNLSRNSMKDMRLRPAPLRDPSQQPRSNSDRSTSDRSSLQSVEPDRVITDSVERPRSAAERTPNEIDTDLSEVTVRELSIEGDGTPVQGKQGHESETDKHVKLQSPETSGKSELPSDDSGPSQYVGDLEEAETVEPLVPQTPKRPLDYTGHPREPTEVTRNVLRMRSMMQRCLRYYHARPEIANKRSNWGMMHAIMVYGVDTKVIVGRNRYSTIAWIAGNNVCRGQRILTEDEGKIQAKSGVGLQGHQAQLLAVLSLAGVPQDYALYVGKQPYTVSDLVDSEMLACKSGEELTFTLIGLSHYLETESEWRDADGEAWDFERLIREELSQPIVGSACGGTHRLMGFAHALRARRAEGLPITGQWKRADQYVKNFVQYTYRLQNRDGSMSTDWFEGREDGGELERKVQTTGHMVEWLLTVTPDSQLQNPKLVSAIRFLLKSMYEERDREWKIGPKGHALRSLAMYYERVFQSGPAWQSPAIAQSRSQSGSQSGPGSGNESRRPRKR